MYILVGKFVARVHSYYQGLTHLHDSWIWWLSYFKPVSSHVPLFLKKVNIKWQVKRHIDSMIRSLQGAQDDGIVLCLGLNKWSRLRVQALWLCVDASLQFLIIIKKWSKEQSNLSLPFFISHKYISSSNWQEEFAKPHRVLLIYKVFSCTLSSLF